MENTTVGKSLKHVTHSVDRTLSNLLILDSNLIKRTTHLLEIFILLLKILLDSNH